LPPEGAWGLWLILAGRGFGKTRAGAEWVRMIGENQDDAIIALVGANLAEARAVMVEGESGLLSVAHPGKRPEWEPSLRRLRWPGGAQARLYSAAEPDSLRGSQHGYAWCDEIAKWHNGGGQALATWDNLKMGLRLGERPRIVATTTPRPVALLRKLLAEKEIIVSRGATTDNRSNLPTAFLEDMQRDYGGTSLGRQELLGEMLDELEGALWSRDLLERCRTLAGAGIKPQRVVIGVDPPASSSGDACGIVVAGLGGDGRACVLADVSVEKASPERWARAVSDATQFWSADKIIAEANQGGEMVRSVLQAGEYILPVKLVHASRNKTARAEPVAMLYEADRVRHIGVFAKLEDQLCGMMAGGDYEGPGRSPDRADALVWALTELMLGRQSRPQLRNLL
jgi:phage terminase large subunit-like protein